MATKRNFIHGLLVLSAIMAALLMSAGGPNHQRGPAPHPSTPSNSLRTGPQPLSTIKSSITVHLYNGLVASLTRDCRRRADAEQRQRRGHRQGREQLLGRRYPGRRAWGLQAARERLGLPAGRRDRQNL